MDVMKPPLKRLGNAMYRINPGDKHTEPETKHYQEDVVTYAGQ